MQADDRDDRDFKCDADPSRAFTRSIMGCCCRAWDKLSKSGASGAFVAPAKTYRRRPGSILRLVGQAFCRNYSTASKQVKFMYDSTNRRLLLVFVGSPDSFEVKQRSRTSLLIGEGN
jgi:hypothetical protein